MNPLLRTEIMSPEFETAYRRVLLEIDIFSTDGTILGKLSCSLLSAALAREFVVDSEPTMLASRAFGDLSQSLFDDEVVEHEEFLKGYINKLEDAPLLWRWWAQNKLYTAGGRLLEMDVHNSDYELEEKVLPETSSEFAALILEVCDAHNPETWSKAFLAEIEYSSN